MNTFALCRNIIFGFIFSFGMSACSNYNFKVKPVPASRYAKAIERAKKDKRYFILQSGINIYNVTSVDLDKAKQQMTVTLDKVDSMQLVYFKNPEISPRKSADEGSALQPEIYVYMKDSTSYTMDEPHTIPLQNVAKIELLRKH